MSACKSVGLLICLVGCYLLGASLGQDLIAKGDWILENVERCPNPEQYSHDLNLRRKKINRTHDAFDFDFTLPHAMNENTGIICELCIKVDGGCKLVQNFTNDNYCQLLMKYAENNINRALKNAGLDEGCPIPEGSHEIRDFVFDYSELPEEGMVGSFQSTAYMVKDNQRVSCMIMDLSFEPKFL